MRILLVATGTAGDILPFVGWGRVLQQRGHEVVFLGSANARSPAEREGFAFVDLECAGFAAGEPSWPTTTLQQLRKAMREGAGLTRRVYEKIAQWHLPGATAVAAQGWLSGARIAQEHLGVPLASVHLQPLMFGKLHEPGRLPEPLGYWCRRLRQRLVWKLLDYGVGREVRAFRRSLGLPAMRETMWDWWRSPQLVLGMFPNWFACPRADWPPQTRLVGFPQFDQLEAGHDFQELEEFLAAGSPPLVFSSPTLVKDDADYFATSAEIARRLGRRAILLSWQRPTMAAALPSGVRHFGFVPLGRLLPRAAALVHHGGMGSLSQALAAGIPQLVVPRFLDQPDNARHLERLGVSCTLRPRQYRAELAADRLAALLESATVRDRCRHYARLSRGMDAYGKATAALEQLLPEAAVSSGVRVR